MKRGIILFLCALLFLNSVSAISTTLKESYEKGETIIAEISGNIIEPITASQVEFKRGHVAVPFKYDFKKLGERYFLWAITPENENNYTLIIKDIVTTLSGKTETINFEQNFSVKGNLTDYSIKPGFISTKTDFSISIKLNEDAEKPITINFPSTRDVILKPGENNLLFSISDFPAKGITDINIGKYLFHAYIAQTKENETNIPLPEEIILITNPSIILSTVLANDKKIYPFQIVNIGKEKAENILIEYNEELFSIERADNIMLEPQTAIELNLTFIGEINDETKQKGIKDVIYIHAENASLELPIYINFTEKKEERDTPYLKNYTKLDYCTNLDGRVCTAGEVCNGEIKTSFDGACCLAACVKQKEEETSNSWIGWLIAGIVVIVIIYAYLRYKKTKGANGFNKRVSIAEEKLNKKLP